MFSLTTFALFMVASLTLNVTPGPDMLYVLGRSLAQGRGAGVLSALGIGAGTLLHIAAAAFGVTALLMTSPLLFQGIKYVGAAYLVYLGVRTLMDRGALDAHALPEVSRRRLFTQAVVTNVLNPKVALFFLAFLPQFIDKERGSVALQIIVLGLCFNVSGTLVNSGVAWLSGSIRHLLQARPRVLRAQRLLCGGLFIGLGVRLALVRLT